VGICFRELPDGARQSEDHLNSAGSVRKEMSDRQAAVISIGGRACSLKKSGTTMSIVSLGDDGHFFIIKEEKRWVVLFVISM
jgi:hypothetical protein